MLEEQIHITVTTVLTISDEPSSPDGIAMLARALVRGFPGVDEGLEAAHNIIAATAPKEIRRRQLEAQIAALKKELAS